MPVLAEKTKRSAKVAARSSFFRWKKMQSVGPAMIKYLAMIAAWAGEKDLACEQLAIAIRRTRVVVTYGNLKLMPFWDPLRGDPRFEKIVASLSPK